MPYTIPRMPEEIKDGRLKPGPELDDFYNWAGLNPRSKVLDAGVGWHGRHYKPLHEKGCQVYGLDINMANLESTKEELKEYKIPSNLICGKFGQMPFPDETFDAVIFNALRPQDMNGWEDAYRVLKKGGKIYIKLILEASHPPGFEEYNYEFNVEEVKKTFMIGYRVDFEMPGDKTKLTGIGGTPVGQTINELIVKIEKEAQS